MGSIMYPHKYWRIIEWLGTHKLTKEEIVSVVIGVDDRNEEFVEIMTFTNYENAICGKPYSILL